MYKVTLINDSEETVIHHPDFNHLKVQSGQILERVNVAGSFSFTVLPFNPGYNSIRPLRTLVKVQNLLTNKLEFEGRILMPTETMDEAGKFAKAFICESELGYLNDSCQRHGEYHDITIRQFLEIMIENHNNDIAHDAIDKTFTVGEVTVTNSTDNLYRYLGYDNTLDSIFDNLVNRLGGELYVRKENGVRYLDYLVEKGELKSTEIKLEKNLKSIQKEVDPSDVITRLIPLGERIESEDSDATDASQARLTIESVNDGIDFIEDEQAKALFSVVTKSQSWDDITQPATLKTRGQQFLQENNRIKIKHVISALDLALIGLATDSFEVGNYHPVINSVMNINDHLRIVEKTTNIINPNESSITAGDLFKTTSQYQHEANKAQQDVVELERRISRQSQSISALKTELKTVDDAVQQVKFELEDGDLPALEDAIYNLNTAVDNLIDAIDEIPVYNPATQTEDGLMSAADKTKLDGLKNYTVASETEDGLLSAADKQKINLINVLQQIDLDDLLARVEALENGTGE